MKHGFTAGVVVGLWFGVMAYIVVLGPRYDRCENRVEIRESHLTALVRYEFQRDERIEINSCIDFYGPKQECDGLKFEGDDRPRLPVRYTCAWDGCRYDNACK